MIILIQKYEILMPPSANSSDIIYEDSLTLPRMKKKMKIVSFWRTMYAIYKQTSMLIY